jgi:hypothetical protein
MTDAERVSGAPRPEWYEIEVGYVLSVVGRSNSSDEPFVMEIEVPGKLAAVSAAAKRFTRDGDFSISITEPNDLRQKLEASVALGMQLAGAITDGEVTIEDLAKKTAVTRLNSVELEGDALIERLDKLADKLGLTPPWPN